MSEKINAEVVAVGPSRVRISVEDLQDFKIADESLKVGSYLNISDNNDTCLIAIIDTFSIEVNTDGIRKHIIDAIPVGLIKDGIFERGGDSIAIPPKSVTPATKDSISEMYKSLIGDGRPFSFSTLANDKSIRVNVNGDSFFGKHIAIVGSTGSGKSHTVASILQKAIKEKEGAFNLNNSHIVIFDIHSEYKTAFPQANVVDIESLILPYWLLNGEELTELFLDTEANDHNQRYVFRQAVVNGKVQNWKGDEKERDKIHFDYPTFFDINEVLKDAREKNDEVIDSGEVYASGAKKGQPKTSQGSLYGKLTNFVNRLEAKISDKRLDFLLGERVKNAKFEDTLRQLMGYQEKRESNITILDVSGVPFEVLSITVSLISRILFDYGYVYKRIRDKNCTEIIKNDVPLLIVYEEAHKYAPNNESIKYRSSKTAIERIAKEGRKYGISLLLASQRPSEISETIFSQCNNFIAMRLTNPADQQYVKRLLPDSVGSLVDSLSTLKAGQALVLGEAITLPSFVQIDKCSPSPSSANIPYLKVWAEEWKRLDIEGIIESWNRI
jgi:ABC-type dipeptide/oligopeptide/nickel transport system ATPase component